jgi:hypothetical protein
VRGLRGAERRDILRGDTVEIVVGHAPEASADGRDVIWLRRVRERIVAIQEHALLGERAKLRLASDGIRETGLA